MATTIEVLTLPYDHQSQSTDCSSLAVLQSKREVINQVSYLVGPPNAQSLILVLTVREAAVRRHAERKSRHSVTYVRQKESEDTGETSKRRAREAKLEAALAALSEEERAGFKALRAWRNAEGIRVGVPPFEVCSNLILIECVIRKPQTLTALRAIKGLGERRVKRFGEALLAQLCALNLIPAQGVER